MKKLLIFLLAMVANVGTMLAENPSWNEEGEIVSVSDALMGNNTGEWIYEEKGKGSTTSSHPATFVVLTAAKGRSIDKIPEADLKPLADDNEIMGTVAFKHTSLNTTMATYACYRYSIPYQIAKLYTEYDEEGNVKKRMIYNYKVTEIVDEEISGSAFVNALVIPHTIERVPENASLNFRNVDTVYIYNTNTSYSPDQPKSYLPTNKLKTIVFKGDFEKIPNCICANAHILDSVYIPNTVKKIAAKAFYLCTNLKSVTIPSSVNEIDTLAFLDVANIRYNGSAHNDTIDYLDLGEVTNWGARSVNGYIEGDCVYRDKSQKELLACCSSVKGEFHINNKVETIGNRAFANCVDITSINIPYTVKNLGGFTFYNCVKLNKITIPQTVTALPDGIFFQCRNLTDISLPQNLKSIGSLAFFNCISMTSITIPNSVEEIDASAFLFSNIYRNPKYWSNGLLYVDNCLVAINRDSIFEHCTIKSGTRLIADNIFQNCQSLKSIEIKDGLTTISKRAFFLCENLKYVTIPNSVASIEEDAFGFCKSLDTIILGEGVKFIGEYAFEGSMIKKIILPKNLYKIGKSAFAYCNDLEDITIPQNVYYIGENAFFGCEEIRNVTCLPNNPPSIGDNVFTYRTNFQYRILPNMKIIVPCTSVNLYRNAWSDYAQRIIGQNCSEDIDIINRSSSKEGCVQKIFRDGQIYILRGDKTYTLTGQRVQ